MNKKIIKITLVNYKVYYMITNSIDKSIQDLLDYLQKEDLFFTSDRKILNVEIIADEIDSFNEIYKEIKH